MPAVGSSEADLAIDGVMPQRQQAASPCSHCNAGGTNAVAHELHQAGHYLRQTALSTLLAATVATAAFTATALAEIRCYISVCCRLCK